MTEEFDGIVDELIEEKSLEKASEIMPDLSQDAGQEDVEFLKKMLEKRTEELSTKDLIIAQKDKELNELREAVRKSSFKKASDPENMNESYDEKISVTMLIMKLRGKQASGWHFVENRMRYIS